jgi:hypothetical protein
MYKLSRRSDLDSRGVMYKLPHRSVLYTGGIILLTLSRRPDLYRGSIIVLKLSRRYIFRLGIMYEVPRWNIFCDCGCDCEYLEHMSKMSSRNLLI